MTDEADNTTILDSINTTSIDVKSSGVKQKDVFGLNRFMSKVRRGDMARANRFAVYINGPAGTNRDRDVSLLCEEAAVPGLQLNYAPAKIGNWTENRVSGLEFYGDTASFTFFIDSSWTPRAYFEEWMSSTVSPLSKEIAFYADTVGTVDVLALNKIDGIVGQWTLWEAFPRTISLTPLGHGGGDGVARMTVTFSYKYWTPGEKGDRRSLLGKILNLRFGSLESSIKNAAKNTLEDLVDDTLNRIF